jgi:hypothetical protein
MFFIKRRVNRFVRFDEFVAPDRRRIAPKPVSGATIGAVPRSPANGFAALLVLGSSRGSQTT